MILFIAGRFLWSLAMLCLIAELINHAVGLPVSWFWAMLALVAIFLGIIVEAIGTDIMGGDC